MGLGRDVVETALSEAWKTATKNKIKNLQLFIHVLSRFFFFAKKHMKTCLNVTEIITLSM